jgi:hypothetical protein
VSPASTTLDANNRGKALRCAGLVTVRQHPGTAKGVTFVTLEDETGFVNVVVWKRLAEKQHRVLLESIVMAVDGVLEASDGVHHLIAKRLHDFSELLPELSIRIAQLSLSARINECFSIDRSTDSSRRPSLAVGVLPDACRFRCTQMQLRAPFGPDSGIVKSALPVSPFSLILPVIMKPSSIGVPIAAISVGSCVARAMAS